MLQVCVISLLQGFKTYRVAKMILGESENFKYAIFDDLGDLRSVTLEGGMAWGSHDPLWGIGNLRLKLTEDEKFIIGILVEDDCVVRSGLQEGTQQNGDTSDSINTHTDPPTALSY